MLNYDGERLILAAQDQGLYTNAFKKVMGLTTNDRCRFCREATESPCHLLSGCKILMGEGRYTARHNKVCRVVHWRLCQHYGIPVPSVSWKHEPPPIIETQAVKLTYDCTIPVARHIHNAALRPDIVVVDKAANSALLIDVSCPTDYGICRQEREKIVKYQDLKNDMKDTYSLASAEVVPIIVGSTGVVKNNLNQYLQMLPCKINALELQVEVVRDSVSILKRVLGCNLAA